MRGEKLTEDELVQLEMAAVSKYEKLTARDGKTGATAQSAAAASRAASSAGGSTRSVSSSSKKQPLPPAYEPNRDGIAELDEMHELRELRLAAQKERATLEETTTQLKKLRSLRLQVAKDPACAAAIPSTRRLEATFPLPDRRGISSAPYDPYQSSSAFAAAASSSSGYAAAGASSSSTPVDAVSAMMAQLRSTLAANHAKVLDLFRTWDRNGDGTVGKPEMRRAIASLGFDAPAEAVDLLFESFDRDGGGAIEYKELYRVLRREAEAEARLRGSPTMQRAGTSGGGGASGGGGGGHRRCNGSCGPAGVPPASYEHASGGSLFDQSGRASSLAASGSSGASGEGGGGGGGGGLFGWLTASSSKPSAAPTAHTAPRSSALAGSYGSSAAADDDDYDDEYDEYDNASRTDDLAAAIYDDSSRGRQDACKEALMSTAAAKEGGGAAHAANGGAPPSGATAAAAAPAAAKATAPAAGRRAAPKARAARGRAQSLPGGSHRSTRVPYLAAGGAAGGGGAVGDAARGGLARDAPGARPAPTFGGGRHRRRVGPAAHAQPGGGRMLDGRPRMRRRGLALHGSLPLLWSAAAARPPPPPRRPPTRRLWRSVHRGWPVHLACLGVILCLLLVLLRQLTHRVAAAACAARPAGAAPPPLAKAKSPLLPLTASGSASGSGGDGGGGVLATPPPFGAWSTLALAELFAAAYMACWALPAAAPATPGDAPAGGAPTGVGGIGAAFPMLLQSVDGLAAPRKLAAIAALLLVLAAVWRALLMALWHCRCFRSARRRARRPRGPPSCGWCGRRRHGKAKVAPAEPSSSLSKKGAAAGKAPPAAAARALACVTKQLEALQAAWKRCCPKLLGKCGGKGAAPSKRGGGAAASKGGGARRGGGKKSLY